jgi:SAM-dependent methyltransferase
MIPNEVRIVSTGMFSPTETARLNRTAWDRWSDNYQAKHGGLLMGANAAAWGLWRQPEDQLRLLGDVAGRDVVELGCGAAHWSLALSGRAARVTAVDNSARQLRHAAAVTDGAVSLVHAAVEWLPFRDNSFDIAFSDYGALSWADPELSVPQTARVLRPGGIMVFCVASPFFFVALDTESKVPLHAFQRPYFGIRQRVVDGCAVDYHVTFGEWVELFGACGLVIERLVEVAPTEDAVTTFAGRSLDWARHWPMEMIWRVRKVDA